ncbi:MAG: ABC transporter substrate-binding protein [Candidatus Sumerlaeaceae bacterium]|nr:ABC transporter substrate-binding protein [Candidatus Sumerlaeaceae bacterium]
MRGASIRSFAKLFTCAAAVAFAGLFGGCGEQKQAVESKGGDAPKVETGPAAGAGASASAPVALEFWHYLNQAHEAVIKQIIADFEKENPGITVRSIFQGNPQQLSQKLSGALAATPPNNPAISLVYENWTSDYVSKGYLDAVENYFSGPDGLSQDDINDFVKVYREANTFEGKMYTLPFNKSMYTMYLNEDMLAKAGLTTAPKTLDELKDAIKKMTVREENRTKTFGMGLIPASEAFTSLYFACGGEYMDDKGNVTLNNPEALKALSLLHDLQYPEKYLYVSTDYMSTPFGNQQIALFIYSSASFPFNDKAVGGKFKWTVAGIPGDPAKPPRYVMQGTNIAIFKSHSEAERKAAWKFVKFLTSKDSSVRFATQTGYMPIRYSILSDPRMKEYMDKNPRYATLSNFVFNDLGKAEPKVAVWEGVREDISQMVDRVLSKGTDPAQELKDTEAKARERVARYATVKTEKK